MNVKSPSRMQHPLVPARFYPWYTTFQRTQLTTVKPGHRTHQDIWLGTVRPAGTTKTKGSTSDECSRPRQTPLCSLTAAPAGQRIGQGKISNPLSVVVTSLTNCIGSGGRRARVKARQRILTSIKSILAVGSVSRNQNMRFPLISRGSPYSHTAFGRALPLRQTSGQQRRNAGQSSRNGDSDPETFSSWLVKECVFTAVGLSISLASVHGPSQWYRRSSVSDSHARLLSHHIQLKGRGGNGK